MYDALSAVLRGCAEIGGKLCGTRNSFLPRRRRIGRDKKCHFPKTMGASLSTMYKMNQPRIYVHRQVLLVFFSKRAKTQEKFNGNFSLTQPKLLRWKRKNAVKNASVVKN